MPSDASGTLTLTSGEDTNITGSKVSGEKVVARISGDLNIASVQDTEDYAAKKAVDLALPLGRKVA